MSTTLPPELMAALGGGGGPPLDQGIPGMAQGYPGMAPPGGAPGMGLPQGLPPGPSGGYGGGDPLQTLQECIQALPTLMAVLPDPQDTQDVAKALLTLTAVQTRMMNRGGGPAGS